MVQHCQISKPMRNILLRKMVQDQGEIEEIHQGANRTMFRLQVP